LKKVLELSSALVLALAIGSQAMAEDDIDTLRRQLAEQRAQNQAQQQQLEQQAKAIDLLSQRLDQLTAGKADAGQTFAGTKQFATVEEQQRSKLQVVEIQRAVVGYLNSAGFRAGDFPGAFKIPGTKDISLASLP